MGRKKQFIEPRVTTAIRVPKSLHEQLELIAEDRVTSINGLVVKALHYFIERLPPLEIDEGKTVG